MIINKMGMLLSAFSLLILVSAAIASATNGCFQNDAECGNIPTNNCDVTQDTTFKTRTYNLTHGIDICSDNIVLDCNGAIIQNPGPFTYQRYGITLNEINNSIVKNCHVTGYQRGILLLHSNHNLIVENNAENSASGIKLDASSSYNTIKGNSANSNYNTGILLRWGSHFNKVIGNTAKLNNLNGIIISTGSHNNLIVNNRIQSNEDGGLVLFSSDNNTISGNRIDSNNIGIAVMWGSNGSIIFSNFVTNNSFRGLIISKSFTTNQFVYNNLFNNSFNVFAPVVEINYWNTTLDCSQKNIIGGPCIGGNFWSNYNGMDINGDGIGDTQIPYNSNGFIFTWGDYLPLVPI